MCIRDRSYILGQLIFHPVAWPHHLICFIIYLSLIHIWAEMDSNHRSITQQIYSLSPLATRESTHLLLLATSCFKQKADDRTRTDNLLITNQLLCQLSHIGIFNCQMTPTGFEPVLPPWKGDVLTAWPWGQVFKSSSPSRARTYNPSVNSRVLYHWAIEMCIRDRSKANIWVILNRLTKNFI